LVLVPRPCAQASRNLNSFTLSDCFQLLSGADVVGNHVLPELLHVFVGSSLHRQVTQRNLSRSTLCGVLYELQIGGAD
jgi:hypothetical protein